jgi:hypothetical protein
LSDLKEKFRDQEIEITLFLPLGTLLKMDDSVARYDQTDADYFYWHRNENEIFKVESDKIRCQNCPNEGGEINIIEENQKVNDSTITTTVSVNGEVVTVKSTGTKKGLSVNKDGVIIKTN